MSGFEEDLANNDPEIIRGPIMNITGSFKIEGYTPEGKHFLVDMTGAVGGCKAELLATRDGYLRSLATELQVERDAHAVTRESLSRVLLENQKDWDHWTRRRRWWRR